MTDRIHISPEDLALYAMRDLSAEESATVRQHLKECAICRAEVAELSGDMALLALSVEQHPLPEGARKRFIDRIAADAVSTLPSTAAKPPLPLTAVPPSTARRSAAWLPWAAVAALVIVSAWLGAKINVLNEKLQDESNRAAELTMANAHAQEVLDVLTAPAAQRVVLTPAKTPPVPTGRAVYLAERGALIFQANNLARLDPDKTYELWIIPANGTSPVPAGLFRPDASGSASVVLPPLPKGIPAKAFGVTVEKAEGATAPTLPIILSGAAAPSGE